MTLITVAADKGGPGVTTTALALAAVWPRPVLLAECDPAGGDLAYRLPAADGQRLDPRRGVLSLAVAARRGLQAHQVWEHTQKLNGGLDVLIGVGNAEQGGGLNLLWGQVGRVLAEIPQADVIADCGRLGTDGPHYDFISQAATVVLVTRATLGEVVRLRDRVAAVAAAIRKRGRPGAGVDVVVVADYKQIKNAVDEVGHALAQAPVPVRIAGVAYDPRGAELLRGEWGGRLDKSLLIRTARDIAGQLVARLPGPLGPGQIPARAAAPARPDAAPRHDAGAHEAPVLAHPGRDTRTAGSLPSPLAAPSAGNAPDKPGR